MISRLLLTLLLIVPLQAFPAHAGAMSRAADPGVTFQAAEGRSDLAITAGSLELLRTLDRNGAGNAGGPYRIGHPNAVRPGTRGLVAGVPHFQRDPVAPLSERLTYNATAPPTSH